MPSTTAVHEAPARRPTRDDLALGAVLAASAAFLAVRLSHELPRGLSSDEIAIVKPVAQWGASYIFFRGDTGMNPPLHPLLFGALGDAGTIPVLGRWFSALCAVSAVGAAATVGWRIGRSRVAAAVAAALVALNPFVAVEGASFRAYAWLVVTLLVRLACMEALVREPPSRGRATWGAYLGLTALLPWIHYGAAPILFFEAPGLALAGPAPRRLVAGHLLAGVLALPLLGLILDNREHVATSNTGFALPEMLGGGFASLGAPFLVVALAHAVAWRRLSPARRVLVAHAAAVTATLLLLPLAVQVRPPATLWALPAVALVFASGAGALARFSTGIPLRHAAWVCVALGLAARAAREDYHDGFLPRLLPRDPSNALRAWARERGEILAGAGAPAVVGVEPWWDVHGIDYYLRAHPRAEPPPDCPRCLTRESLSLEPCDPEGSCRARRRLIIHCERAEVPPSRGCEEVWRNACGAEWLCP